MRNRAFTLIELLVVIAIIGILSSVVLASLSEGRERARDAARFTDLRNLKTALEAFYLTNGRYPIASDSTGQAGSRFWNYACASFEYTPTQPSADCWNGTHAGSLKSQLGLSTIPTPTANGTSITDCTGQARQSVYLYQSDGVNYKLSGSIENSCAPPGSDGGTQSGTFEMYSTGGQAF